MTKVSGFEMTRNAWTLNDLVTDGKGGGKLIATHLCYVAQYGRTPVYAIHFLKTGTIGRFNGTAEALFKLFVNKTPVKVSLQSKTVGYSEFVPAELRDAKINEQVSEEIEIPSTPQEAAPEAASPKIRKKRELKPKAKEEQKKAFGLKVVGGTSVA